MCFFLDQLQFGSRSIRGRFDRAFSPVVSLQCSRFFTGAYNFFSQIFEQNKKKEDIIINYDQLKFQNEIQM